MCFRAEYLAQIKSNNIYLQSLVEYKIYTWLKQKGCQPYIHCTLLHRQNLKAVVQGVDILIISYIMYFHA